MEEEPQDSRSAFAARPHPPIMADVPSSSFQRQFSRIVEMLILRGLQPDDSKLNRAYRLQVRVDLEGSRLSPSHPRVSQVKERIFRFNYVSV